MQGSVFRLCSTTRQWNMLRGKERGNISTEEWLGQDLSTVTDSTISLSVILHRPPSCSDYVLKHQQIIFSNI
jgi:hypothetical protein